MTSPSPRRPTCTSVVIPRQQPSALVDLIIEGDLSLARRDGDRAAGAYVTALEEPEADQPELLARLGAANSVRVRLGEAETCFLAVLEREPGHIAALRGLIAVFRETERPDEAFAVEELLFAHLDPEHLPFALVDSGDRWWAADHLRYAKLRYSAALRLVPEHFRAQKRLRDVVNAQVNDAQRLPRASGDTLPGIGD